MVEGSTNVRKQLHKEAPSGILAEAFSQRQTKICGDMATDETGDMKEWFNQVLLAVIQFRRHLVTSVRPKAAQA